MAVVNEDVIGKEDPFEWNVEAELKLFEAMSGHKPVGVSKYFHMMCICDKLEAALGKPVPSDAVWSHLESMYDMAALDENESLPFPNNEEEFALPDADYSELMAEKLTENISSEKDKEAVTKVMKDYSRQNKASLKEEGNSAPEEAVVSDVGGQAKGKGRKRGPKSKETVLEKESSPATSTSSRKTDEDVALAPNSSSTKAKQSTGSTNITKKRSLRPRSDEKDEVSSNKSITPPPAKRARRI